MKKIIYKAILLFCVLICIFVFNVIRKPSLQTEVEPGEKESVPIDGAVNRLSKAVRFKTVSSFSDKDSNSDQFQGINRHIETNYPLLNAKLKRTKAGAFSFFYEWKGIDETLRPILLSVHSDVVDADSSTETSWSVPPFSGEVKEGFIWGRGVLDDKASLFAILESVEILLARGFRPKRTVFIAVGADEELVYGTSGAKSISEIFRKLNIHFEFVLDEGQLITEGMIPGIEKPVALVGIAGKGYLTLRLVVNLREGGHSSLPPENTAIGVLVSALNKLEGSPFPYSLTPVSESMFRWLAPESDFVSRLLFSNLWLFRPFLESKLSGKSSTRAQLHTTTAITQISGGFKDNVLPARAEAVVNIRILQGDTHRSVLRRISEIIDDDRVSLIVPETIIDPSPVSATDSKGFETIRRSIVRVIPDAIVAPALVAAYTDSMHYFPLADNVYRFFPIRATTDDLKRFHGIDERIKISNYEEMIRFYAEIFKNLNIQ
ncbi:M20 family peptidase [Leptospira gomenensis]|uniref:M20 family peptidase n=1 Tax=Leptospira gomenensis TaxID=2484974 RepID=UPI0014385D9C|nr:M20 family peptidase [Leptospira gomenensis]